MDDVDFEILSTLCKDARVPFGKIATKLGISKKTVLRRFKKLQKDGTILGSTVTISSEVSGFRELAGFFIKTKSGTSISTIKNKLISIPKINLVVQEWGIYDFYAEAFLRDLSEIHEVLDNLRKVEGIVVVAPMVYRQRDWTIPYLLPSAALCFCLSPSASQGV